MSKIFGVITLAFALCASAQAKLGGWHLGIHGGPEKAKLELRDRLGGTNALSNTVGSLSAEGATYGLHVGWDYANKIYFGLRLVGDFSTMSDNFRYTNTQDYKVTVKKRAGGGAQVLLGGTTGSTGVYLALGGGIERLDVAFLENSAADKDNTKGYFRVGFGTKSELWKGLYLGMQADRSYYQNVTCRRPGNPITVSLKTKEIYVDAFRLSLGYTF